MRVVLDTNVLVSGIFFKGAPFEILQAWRRGRFQLCISPEILLEYQAVLERLRDEFPTADAMAILGVIVSSASVVDAPPLREPVSADPDDDKFIACAVAAGARFVVSGDRDLLDIEAHGRVRILSPRAFVDDHANPAPPDAPAAEALRRQPDGCRPVASMSFRGLLLGLSSRALNGSHMSEPAAQTIVSDPAIAMGKPVVSGTRITVELILEKLAAGESPDDLLAAHPRLTRDGIKAALAHAAAVLKNEVVHPVGGEAA